MNINELDKRIEIQHYKKVENKLLEETKGWVKFEGAWASIKCVGNGREQIKNKDELTLKYEITMRYRPGITTKMRIKYRDTFYSINHVVNYLEKNEELHLFCTVTKEGVYNE